jgi:queuine tRNA-ribosyltransferase
VGTQASVKGVTPEQLRAAGVEMVLANTYHLMLRPGSDTVRSLGGVHRMMAWDGPLLTDSGGYQVFSLAHLCRIDEEGVVFRSHIDGREVALSAEGAVEVQRDLGADVIMQLDECPSARASKGEVAEAVRRSAAWAARGRNTWQACGQASAFDAPQALFGIQQGGVHADLRAESAEALVALDLPGYAIGGLSVGEAHEAMCEVLDAVDEQFPRDRPRYLMGVGEPRDILAAVRCGVDMFDCVLPTRNGRNAQAFTWNGRVRLRNSRWARCADPLDAKCDCCTCRGFSRGTLRHLFLSGEMLAPTLVSIHNLRFFTSLMSAIRRAIAAGDLAAKQREWLGALYADQD